MDSSFSLTNVVAAAISFSALLGTIFFMFHNRKSRSHQENKTTASSLPLLSPPTSLPSHYWKYHVFPSFHGPDVRKGFLSHFLKEFKSKGINAFVDNDMERSKTIGHELIEAIRGSRIAIVLLSNNYASSTWCLNELVEIVKCREELDQTVVSLFYEVDPTDVKKQTGYFGKVFKKTCKGKTKEDIQKWKHALIEVAQIAGYHSTNWDTETEMIEAIATDVSNKLNNSTPSNDFDGLVGMEFHMRNIEPLLQLDSDEVRTIGILGPSGIGKTTFARCLFNQHSQYFQLAVFMDRIKTIPACSDDYNVKLELQKQLMSQITKEVDIKIPHLGIAKYRLKGKKVLLVLDGVDRLVQLESMAKETCWFDRGSQIIITTQDQKILTAGGIEHIYRMDLPSGDKALQIFCMYAFDQKSPKVGFTKLAWEVTRLVGRLPLGLRVMGSYFRGMCKEDWTKALPSLKTRLDPDGEIMSILKFSYDALCDEDKRLFLHIACFFNHSFVDTVEGCLASCFLDVTQGLHVLAGKSLISEDSGRIKMHKLLVQLGRKIVREQSVSEPGKRQFLIDAIDIDDVLNDDKAGSSSVLGIRDPYGKIICTSERAFERLSNLQFLRIISDGINAQSMNSISGKLRLLSWWKFGMPFFPSSFNPKFLVKLDMWGSKLKKLWEEPQPLSNLKWMDLRDSESLEELPDLSSATSLYDLNLSGCSGLVKLPSSIGNAINLHILNLNYCSSLMELPSSMRDLRKLSQLELRKCSKLEVLLTNINLESLVELNLSDCSLLKSYPKSSTNIQDLKPSGTTITEAPPSMRPRSLMRSRPLFCKSKMCGIQELGPWIGRISCLRRLVLSGMKNLASLPQLPYSVVELEADDCESLERLDCYFRNPGIRLLNFGNCIKLNKEARDLIIQTPTNEYAVLPGGEVPWWFTYLSYGGSLKVKLNQKALGPSTKFKACIICAGEVGKEFENWETANVTCSIKSNENALTCYKNIGRVFPGNMYTFEVEVEEVTSTELVFEFDIRSRISELNWKTWKIEGCGILQILEVPSC